MTKIAPPAQRRIVLLRLAQREHTLDVVNRYAVDDYAAQTGAPVMVMPFGANKCPMMGRDLGAMFKDGLLCRHASGLWNMAGMGFPRWVWSYRLTDAGRAQLAKAEGSAS